MFDLDAFIDECRACLDERDVRGAVRAVVARTMRRPEHIGDRLRPQRGGITVLHHSPDLTIIDVVWAPRMRIFAHDHRRWAVIGVYTGREDNEFFRHSRGRLVASNGRTLDTGDAVALGERTIHAVSNPTAALTGAIHVYGGDFVNQQRSQWRPPNLDKEPYDAGVVAEFEAANHRWSNTLATDGPRPASETIPLRVAKSAGAERVDTPSCCRRVRCSCAGRSWS